MTVVICEALNEKNRLGKNDTDHLVDNEYHPRHEGIQTSEEDNTYCSDNNKILITVSVSF